MQGLAGRKRGKYTNWYQPHLADVILSTVARIGSVERAVNHLNLHMPIQFSKLSSSTIRGWFMPHKMAGKRYAVLKPGTQASLLQAFERRAPHGNGRGVQHASHTAHHFSQTRPLKAKNCGKHMCVIIADCWHSAAQFKEAEDIIVEALNGLRDSGGMVNSSIASCIIRGMLEVHAPEALEGSKAINLTLRWVRYFVQKRMGWTYRCLSHLSCDAQLHELTRMLSDCRLSAISHIPLKRH